ncbi:MAG TPA: histidine phosphatase family protein [Solirubrobacteraceae bacterium]|jgi:probable phosphoglycerate mutase|nr:histidine phosphatase family protein [Solirubrobacteraceae bacterium]
MSNCVFLLRHGDTEWTEHELHTGRQDVPLSDRGREQAREARRLLSAERFDHVLVSPQSRARETAELAGVGALAELDDDLVEWDYGEYEGKTDAEVRRIEPAWDLFRDGAPGGETPPEVAVRVDRVLARVSALDGVVLLVGHGKTLRALAARWLRRDVALGSALAMDPAAISVLEREAAGPLLRLWNYTAEGLGDPG